MKRYEVIYKTVRSIPRGRVATYGQVAEASGMDGHARLVGYAMHAVPQRSGVPWQRVINSAGRISLPGLNGRRQRDLLEKEGVKFLPSGKVDLKKYRAKLIRLKEYEEPVPKSKIAKPQTGLIVRR